MQQGLKRRFDVAYRAGRQGTAVRGLLRTKSPDHVAEVMGPEVSQKNIAEERPGMQSEPPFLVLGTDDALASPPLEPPLPVRLDRQRTSWNTGSLLRLDSPLNALHQPPKLASQPQVAGRKCLF